MAGCLALGDLRRVSLANGLSTAIRDYLLYLRLSAFLLFPCRLRPPNGEWRALVSFVRKTNADGRGLNGSARIAVDMPAVTD